MKKIIIVFFLLMLALVGHSQSSYIAIQDTRVANDPPSYFKARLALDFKESSVIGAPGGTIYSAVLTVAPWVDNTGGKNHQLSFNDGGLFYRVGSQLSPTWESWRKIVIENEAGNVGIGTADTKGYKLAVNGSMVAESLKVKLYGAWPDFVFAKDYRLPSLQETEKHIKEKGHLPGIPSAVEVNANGIDLGEMNAKLLQKIEELTLYLIEQNKEISELKREIYKSKKD